MVFTESSVMRDANAIQMLLDGCRRCYWTVRESDSVNTFSTSEDARLVGEVNALVDELLVVIELLLVAAPPSLAADDVRCLLGFMVDCPQPNQDLLILACSHPENRSSLTRMDEWPEWILEILISNHETGGSKTTNLSSLRDVEDFIHNFLIIMLEHSMRQKDGWKTQVIAAAAAGVAAEGLAPKDAKIEAENAAQLSVALVENAIVILMLVEDHLRLQSKLYSASCLPTTAPSPLSKVLPVGQRSSNTVQGETSDPVTSRNSSASDSGALPLNVWHAIAKDRSPLRKQYLEAILPPFVAILRRWRPLLAGIHELATADGINPLIVDDRALAADALPVEAALAMISPSWAASFASPPAAMALAMIAAGAAGGEVTVTTAPQTTSQLRRDTSLLERKTTRLHTFASFQKPLEAPSKSPNIPKDKAAAKAAALAAARDLERNAKIGSGRGLIAVAMATSAQRRSKSDTERVKRWNVSEAMGTAWTECLQSVDSKSVYGKDFNALSYKYIAVLVGSLALARNMQRSEVDRRSQVDLIARHRLYTGMREWRKLIHCLIEMKCLFGPFSDDLCNPKRIFWKLDFMETSSRMRRILRRNYQGSDHLGAAANYEDHMEQKHDKHKPLSPSKASMLAAEVISTDVVNEEDEHDATYLDVSPNGEHPGEIQTIQSAPGEQPLTSEESTDPPVSSEIDSAAAVAPGYVPSEDDERIVLEIPSSMVRPLKVLRGTLQSTEGRRNAYRAIVQARPPHLNNIYLATQRPEQLLKRTQLMERWARWEISNFEYLMQLNTLAGRSYNDITQVLYYLTRVEPFTTLSIQLQGGKFDHADRMFSDVAATWNGVLEDMSDVKELVPELFYLPEVLTNENSIDFGTTQLGEKLGSVRLPPWAENPVDFVHKHRMALESEHASEHLHEWIDLIFGYKQRGKEAIQANNVFFYITYEGTVDIDKILDPVQQRATQDQIAYFGQTPSQLLTVPHMKRMSLADVLHMQ
ncbi:UNVERIFIED_CONTAM: BEACH domain-containing protein C2, partial [Sesamum latifolium]